MNARTSMLRSMLPLQGAGLEIGPGYNPLVPKSEGFSVETVDYTDQAGLREKYYNNPHVDVERIETVDHVLDGSKTLLEAVGRPEGFSYIVASHVIEHTPDMLAFLKSCEGLLAPQGILLLAVPDKRHCFDVLQPLSSTGAVLQAYFDARTRPTPGAIFDDVAYNAVREGQIGWGPEDRRALTFFASLEAATSALTSARQDPGYRDVHVWRFVPSSFRLIVGDLHEIGELGLREHEFYDSVGNEFYITMSASGQGCPIARLSLAKRALIEQAGILLDDL
ncbi:methyltransferase domain-containing protein [Acidisoma cladoniae]|jgi:SAM-dependent methyltransferase|uniref:methyltransferase domain-containing protein n=1 Tax=Acidisoma cladoniae TaxID=3040935 RepID=UPI00254B63F0|nr:methyltransferase domain-containing protein [Acidisoma sp. PAMC 29798]